MNIRWTQSFSQEDIRRAFENAYRVKDPIIELCKADAIEYFKSFHLESKQNRMQLSKENKLRVFGFMKERKKYYNENGFMEGM